MTNKAIEIENLGKRYKLGLAKSDSLRESLSLKIKGIFSAQNQNTTDESEFWALRNLNLNIEKGEAVGIIGKNGAGKSTLLKILSRIAEPSEGRFKIDGRTSSLLEVGTGFHPELTGRENVFLNGTILGMKRKEIKEKFDEIVAFSGVEKFIDTAVKHYSSGMKVRLAFSVAAHLEPEILIIDEVLAVGDAEFQKKCLGKMDDVASQGRTVLFVSHNMTALQNLCNKGVVLKGGVLDFQGSAKEAVTHYMESFNSEMSPEVLFEDASKAPGNAEAKLRKVAVVNDTPENLIYTNSSFHIEVEYSKNVPKESRMDVTIQIYNDAGIRVFSTSSWHLLMNKISDVIKLRCQIPANLMNEGAYFIHVLLVKNNAEIILREENLLRFEIIDNVERKGWQGKIGGVVRPQLQWNFY